MACSNCKKKKEKFNVDFEETANKNGLTKRFNVETGIDQEKLEQSFVLRGIVFVILLLGFPLIYIGVLVMLFVNFFMPSKNPTAIFTGFFEFMTKKYVEFKTKKQIRKMEKEFESHKEYDGDNELSDIEVFESEEIENNVEIAEK